MYIVIDECEKILKGYSDGFKTTNLRSYFENNF